MSSSPTEFFGLVLPLPSPRHDIPKPSETTLLLAKYPGRLELLCRMSFQCGCDLKSVLPHEHHLHRQNNVGLCEFYCR